MTIEELMQAGRSLLRHAGLFTVCCSLYVGIRDCRKHHALQPICALPFAEPDRLVRFDRSSF